MCIYIYIHIYISLSVCMYIYIYIIYRLLGGVLGLAGVRGAAARGGAPSTMIMIYTMT